MTRVRFVWKTCGNVSSRLFIDDFSGSVSVSRVTRRLANNEFEWTWHKEKVADLWTARWYVSHFYVNTWLGDQLWSRIGGKLQTFSGADTDLKNWNIKNLMAWFTAIPWRRFFWSKILKYLLHLFYLYILCGWSHFMLSQRMLRMQGKETVCYLNVSTQVWNERKARLSFIPRNVTHRSSQVNLLFTHSKKGAPTRCTCIVLDKFNHF